MKRIQIGEALFEGYEIPTPNSVIQLIRAKRGFLGCG